MHDPLVVAFEIHRPWPARTRLTRGRRYYPAVVTVWHREPGGHDSGSICGYRRMKWHVHHWRIQVPPLQKLRRRLLTRCAWCGGKHVKGDPVNVSHSWDGPRGRWWQGEPGLFHGDCSGISAAHASCTCESPITEFDGWGKCLRCGKFRPWGRSDVQLARTRELAAVPAGRRAV